MFGISVSNDCFITSDSVIIDPPAVALGVCAAILIGHKCGKEIDSLILSAFKINLDVSRVNLGFLCGLYDYVFDDGVHK